MYDFICTDYTNVQRCTNLEMDECEDEILVCIVYTVYLVYTVYDLIVNIIHIVLSTYDKDIGWNLDEE